MISNDINIITLISILNGNINNIRSHFLWICNIEFQEKNWDEKNEDTINF